ncbi:protein orai-3-like isoform X2 [Copidosoma floridanum]|uniref:protein orai-3-like isoform X2 n=1 Tax=Copidosoma floridanum TaxID=29053 RepID=UPI0006C96D66|nr:protein orai-3-like isoform X2 [Copidosoma floridanum]
MPNTNNNSIIDMPSKKVQDTAPCQIDMEPQRRLSPKTPSVEDLPSPMLTTTRSTKSTQIDASTWRLAHSGYHQRARPMSVGQLSRQSQYSELSYANYAVSPNYAFSATQSEILLSPRSRPPVIPAGGGRYTAVDMVKVVPGSGCGGCCCSCGAGASVVPGGPSGTGASAGNQSIEGPKHPPTEAILDNKHSYQLKKLHMSRAKLKATVAMVELQINEPTAVPEWLFVMFAVCTTVLVSVHIFALMISTYLLPNVEAISKLQSSRLITESPHERMRGFIELAWAFSTVLGLFLFLVEIAILSWVKFWDYSFTAATASTVIVIPVLIVFIAFAVHFYHSLVVYKCEASLTDMRELENIKRNLDNASLGQRTGV